VPAYSTLGWLADPVTDPMLRHGDPYLVETLIHELVHATVFFADDADFNEGIASFIGQEGAVRFYALRGQGEAVRAQVEDERVVQAALLSLRAEIGALYAASEPGAARERHREALEGAARERLADLPLRALDAAAIAEHARLNDACLSIAATYAADLSAYAERLARMGGDLPAFIARARALEGSNDPRAEILAGVPYPAAMASVSALKDGRASTASE
jgi:predicted aminopeptidase